MRREGSRHVEGGFCRTIPDHQGQHLAEFPGRDARSFSFKGLRTELSWKWSDLNEVPRQSGGKGGYTASHGRAPPKKQYLWASQNLATPFLTELGRQGTCFTGATAQAPKLPDVNVRSFLPSDWTVNASSIPLFVGPSRVPLSLPSGLALRESRIESWGDREEIMFDNYPLTHYCHGV